MIGTADDALTGGAYFNRYSLLHGLPDGKVTRWILAGLPELNLESARGAHFVSPKANLSTATMQWAVEARHSRAEAEFLGALLHAATSRRAVVKLVEMGSNLLRGLNYVQYVHGFPEQRHVQLEIPASAPVELAARALLRPAVPADITGKHMRAYRFDRDTWSEWITTDSAVLGPRKFMVVSKALWNSLGDDPAAWALAFDLFMDEATVMPIQEVIDTVAATLPDKAGVATKKWGPSLSWRFARPQPLQFEGQPLEGLHTPLRLELQPVIVR